MKLSPTQLRVLRYASEGRLRQKADGRYVIRRVGLLLFDELAAAQSLESGGAIEWDWYGRGSSANLLALAVVTPKGAALLEEHPDA